MKPVSAFDGEEGLQKAGAENPDLILLDIILPKKDGYEVLARNQKKSAKRYSGPDSHQS